MMDYDESEWNKLVICKASDRHNVEPGDFAALYLCFFGRHKGDEMPKSTSVNS